MLVLSLVLVVGFLARLGSSVAEPPKPTAAALARTPWTTSRVVGSPDPPTPYKVVRAFPNLKFEHPTLIARFPDIDFVDVGGAGHMVAGDRNDLFAGAVVDFLARHAEDR